jgi:hypothetical protein
MYSVMELGLANSIAVTTIEQVCHTLYGVWNRQPEHDCQVEQA